jgi:cytolysin (calcineurin-like family phosphatase)
MTEAPETIRASLTAVRDGWYQLVNLRGGQRAFPLTEYTRSDIAEELQAEVARLKAAHGNLWRALADIMEQPGDHPNATVRRMAAFAEKALVHDTVADIQPVPRFYKI